MRIILTGLMGAGKTTVGRLVARRLGWAFLDLDELVELSAGRSIPALFAEEGEAGFRAREAEALEAALALEHVVIATGGGTVITPANRQRLAQEPWVFWLTASPAQLARRVARSTHRPLLKSGAPAAGGAAGRAAQDRQAVERRLEDLLAQRSEAYAAVARQRVATDGRSPEQVAAAILERWQAEGGSVSPAAVPSPDPAATGGQSPGQVVTVTAGQHRYPVHVRPGGLDTLAALWDEPAPGRAAGAVAPPLPGPRPSSLAFVVSDPVVAALYRRPLENQLRHLGLSVAWGIVPAGEEAKTLDWAQHLYDGLLAAGADRDTWVFALGGGVVGDLAGFVAATYMRGVPFVQLPTTLLAQVDASVGGKVAVNHRLAKNLVGAFHQPQLVVVDPTSLRTLPSRTYRCGLAEMVKHALLDSADHLARLQAAVPQLIRRDAQELTELIASSIAVKARYVAMDPQERGVRAHLNLGHTFAHALEAATDYRVPHGEAVAAGLCLATALSARWGLCPPHLSREVAQLLAALGLPTSLAAAATAAGVPVPSPEELWDRLQYDKKKRGGRVRFVLIQAPGAIQVRDDVPGNLVMELLARSAAGQDLLGGSGAAGSPGGP